VLSHSGAKISISIWSRLPSFRLLHRPLSQVGRILEINPRHRDHACVDAPRESLVIEPLEIEIFVPEGRSKIVPFAESISQQIGFASVETGNQLVRGREPTLLKVVRKKRKEGLLCDNRR
jgi:hypothetical protein